MLPALELAPPTPPALPTAEERRRVREAEEADLRAIRMELRDICMALGSDKRCAMGIVGH